MPPHLQSEDHLYCLLEYQKRVLRSCEIYKDRFRESSVKFDGLVLAKMKVSQKIRKDPVGAIAMFRFECHFQSQESTGLKGMAEVKYFHAERRRCCARLEAIFYVGINSAGLLALTAAGTSEAGSTFRLWSMQTSNIFALRTIVFIDGLLLSTVSSSDSLLCFVGIFCFKHQSIVGFLLVVYAAQAVFIRSHAIYVRFAGCAGVCRSPRVSLSTTIEACSSVPRICRVTEEKSRVHLSSMIVAN